MKPRQMEHYTVIIYTGGFYFLFPDKWLFRNNKAIFCPQDFKSETIKDGVFYYKHHGKYTHIAGSIFRLWWEKRKLQKESKHKYYRQKAIFKVYFWRGSFNAWMRGYYPKYYKRHKQLQLLDRKIMTFGTFLKYFGARTEKEGSLAWECYTKKHFKRTIATRQPKRELDKGYIAKKLLESIELIESGKTVHITKIKSLNRLANLYDSFDYEVFYGFARFIANRILGYYLAGESLCAEETVPKEQKERILRKAVALINGCFDETACDIELPNKVAVLFDEIEEMNDGKRINCHSLRATLKDSDLLAMRECLGFFINDNNKYRWFWKREYDIAKYYCVSYSDMRFRLQGHSIPRILDILEFVDEYIEGKKHTIGPELENTIKIFLENTTKGYEARKELFNKISSELYDVFYKNKQVKFEVDSVFDTWLNLAGALGDNFECLKILFFVVENQSMFKSYQIGGAKCILLDEKWLRYFENLTGQEILILHKLRD